MTTDPKTSKWSQAPESRDEPPSWFWRTAGKSQQAHRLAVLQSNLECVKSLLSAEVRYNQTTILPVPTRLRLKLRLAEEKLQVKAAPS